MSENQNSNKVSISLEETIHLEKEIKKDGIYTLYFLTPIRKNVKIFNLKGSFFFNLFKNDLKIGNEVKNYPVIDIEILCNLEIDEILIDENFKKLKVRKFSFCNSGIKSLDFLLKDFFRLDIEEILLKDNKIETSEKEIKKILEKYQCLKFDLSNSKIWVRRNYIKGGVSDISKNNFSDRFMYERCTEEPESQNEDLLINTDKNLIFLKELKKKLQKDSNTFYREREYSISDDDINSIKQLDYLKDFEDENNSSFFNKNFSSFFISILCFFLFVFSIFTFFNFKKIAKLKNKIKEIEEKKIN